MFNAGIISPVLFTLGKHRFSEQTSCTGFQNGGPRMCTQASASFEVKVLIINKRSRQ